MIRRAEALENRVNLTEPTLHLRQTSESFIIPEGSSVSAQKRDIPPEHRPNSTSFMPDQTDLVCLSHLRWDFVYQRPQHIMSRFARHRRVFFVEEPVHTEGVAHYTIEPRTDQLYVVVPHIPHGLSAEDVEAAQRKLLEQLLEQQEIVHYVAWFYTPMALGFAEILNPLAVVYDCMDELSMFKGAPPILHERERNLFDRADLVFTGGVSLYQAKREQHRDVHLFPSSIDRVHFERARRSQPEPVDQAGLASPRLGFFGVIDERFDIPLLEGMARLRPHWQFVMLGPVVKIDPATLPILPNIHYLGGKSYQDLPAYLSGWDIALLLFARNDATRFISPTKTPEYLAGGKPVVSTPIRDVVEPYGTNGLVEIAETSEQFVAAAEALLARSPDRTQEWLRQVDSFLESMSWDKTWGHMNDLISSRLIQTVRSLDS